MLSFHELGLIDLLLQNVADEGYSTPTAIQAKAIPLLLEGQDLLGIAQTGTGKTAAYCLPIIQLLTRRAAKRGAPRVLILAPTRELCSQINLSMGGYAKNLDIKSCAIFGGVDQKEQVRLLKEGMDVLVATPGRLLDLSEQRLVSLAHIETLVLDEADRMLDMGFMDDIEAILKKLPDGKQIMLFSATMPPLIEKFARKLLKNPARVETAPVSSTAENIQQKVIFCKRDHKYQLLKKIVKEEKGELFLVFTKTRKEADSVVEYLAQNRIPSRAIHGDKDQAHRERALDHFREKVIKVLVATDVASRGLDIDGVSHVINFDLPLEPESYVHRIGRTARAGKTGVAVSFCENGEKSLLLEIEQLIQKELPHEKFEGKFEALRLRPSGTRQVKAPTPGKSQEKNAWLDHSKRQRVLKEGEKRAHPGFKKTKKRRK